MIAHPQTETREAEQNPFLELLTSALREAFGQRFELWLWDGCWIRIGNGASGSPEHPEIDQTLASHLDRLLEASSEPTILDDGRDEYLLAIPFIQQQTTVVAVGRFSKRRQPPETQGEATGDLQRAPKPNGGPFAAKAPYGDPELLKRVSRLFVQNFNERLRWNQFDQELNAYAAQVSQSYEEVTLLHELTNCLDVSQDIWQAAQTVLPPVQELLRAQALVLVSAETRGDGEGDRSSAIRVGHPAVWIGPRIIDDQTCGRLVEKYRAAAESQPVVRNHQEGQWHVGARDAVRSFILVRTAKPGYALGWLMALNCEDGQEFGTVEASLLNSAAMILATHGRNIELLRERESLLIGAVRALVSAIDAKDPYTYGHSERVALIAQRLGKELGLNAQQCERLYLTGLLHDVGKIGVSDVVLAKPGKLTPEEFEEIKQHVEVGYAILEDLRQLQYVLPGVRHHHESYNGTGYPDHLQGEQIPLAARILAVADAYDAMSSDRPYRPGMPPERVEQILRDGAGKQWDDRVVKTALRILPEIRAICREYRPHLPIFQTGSTPSWPKSPQTQHRSQETENTSPSHAARH